MLVRAGNLKLNLPGATRGFFYEFLTWTHSKQTAISRDVPRGGYRLFSVFLANLYRHLGRRSWNAGNTRRFIADFSLQRITIYALVMFSDVPTYTDTKQLRQLSADLLRFSAQTIAPDVKVYFYITCFLIPQRLS